MFISIFTYEKHLTTISARHYIYLIIFSFSQPPLHRLQNDLQFYYLAYICWQSHNKESTQQKEKKKKTLQTQKVKHCSLSISNMQGR